MKKAFFARATNARHKSLSLMTIFLLWALVAHAQNFTFFAEQATGIGGGNVQIEIVNPAATTGDSYRVFITENAGGLFFSVENVTTQTIPANQLPAGSTSPEFEGIKVTVPEDAPQYKDIIEVRYGNTLVDPPVHVFRPGDLRGRGGNNSTNEYTFVGGAGDGGYGQISRGGSNEALAAPYDYELRFDGNPSGKNVFVHAFRGGEGTYFNAPFSLWNGGIGTPNDPSDDYQIIAVGFDDSGNPAIYDGGAPPSDGGNGTMFDRIYFYDLNRNAGAAGDINNDGVIDYDDFLQDLQNHGGDLSSVLRSRPYVRGEVIGRFCLVSLNGDPSYLPPVGTTIRITTTKPLSEADSYTFITPEFGMFSTPTAIAFGKVAADRPATKPVKIFNSHHGDIMIDDISTANPAFRVSPTRLALAPGDSALIAVSFAPTRLGVFEDTLTISGNDPFFPRYKIPLSGHGLPPATGAISLLGQIDVPGPETTDVWGYLDPNTGKEYALVGYGIFTNPPNAGLFIVDVTNPSNPVAVANVNTVPGFDVKTWQHYAYTVNGVSGIGGIVDISDPAKPRVVGSFPSAHNIFIDEKGFMYLEIPGLQIFDLKPDPTKPTLVWSDGTFGGHDAAVIGNRLYDFHGNAGTNIYDVSNPASPQLLGSIVDPTIRYHHSGWPTEDGKFLFICDELATHPSADVTVWDISAVGNPERVGEFADPDATVHNLYVAGNFAYLSYYTAGFRVLDISDPKNPRIADGYDTSLLSGEGFNGAFGAYPFAPSNNIYVSDIENGLFVFSFAGRTTGVDVTVSDLPAHYALFANYPNPFLSGAKSPARGGGNSKATITYQLPKSSKVKLEIYDTLGQRIRTLVNAVQPAGTHKIFWDGESDSQAGVSSGIYFYRLQADEFTDTKRLLLLK
jgi:choice-of-anchor B domain-containing protein